MPLKCSLIAGFVQQNGLLLVSAPAQQRCPLNAGKYMFEENLGTQSGVHLMEGVRLKVSLYKIKQLFLKINLPNYKP